jgi:hypothetical protein
MITDKYPCLPYITLQKIVGYMWQQFKRMPEYANNGFPLEFKLMCKPFKVRDNYNQFRKCYIEDLKKLDDWKNADDKTLWKEAARKWTELKLNPNNEIANQLFKMKFLSNNQKAIDNLQL